MSEPYAWVRRVAQQLSDQRQVAGWRPATLEAASFSSRGMRILRTLERLEAVLRDAEDSIRDVPVSCNLCAEATAYLIVWLHELDVKELADVATTPVIEHGWETIPSDVSSQVLDSWEYWSEDRLKDSTRAIGAAIVDMLVFCKYLNVDVEREIMKLDFGKRKPGCRHPDTW